MNRFLLDLVHHNPGEPPFESRYTDPAFLARLGYNGMVLKHLNACAPLGNFPANGEEARWLEAAQAERDREIAAAKAAGIAVYYHIDLFVLPKAVIEARRADICDARGRVDITRPAALELHRELFAAMAARYPDVDGFVIRVGETYLYDTPHHGGNTAVPLHDPDADRAGCVSRFITLLRFLREEVCERLGKTLIHRTWDYFGDRFHSDAGFYLDVTNAIPPHPRLVFSIKHTAGDFFRGCAPNPCLGIGAHPQIIEVQCAREYEGKGAYPNYIARAVIEGFPETPAPKGLRDWARTPQYAGLWTWSRGGGWYGPYLADEFWPDLNARVLAAWAREPETPEEAHFERVCREVHGMDGGSARALREICRIAEQAVWLGRSIPAYARLRNFADADSACLWMRDDRLGGLDRLGGIFEKLEEAGMLDDAVAEKREAARLFGEMTGLARHVRAAEPKTTDAIRTSAEYGARLFALIAEGWDIMVRRWRAAGGAACAAVTDADVRRFEDLARAYAEVARMPRAASLYKLEYWHFPGDPPAPGMGASVGTALRIGE